MESNRKGNQLNAVPRHSSQAGMTLIGMLMVVVLIGMLGLAIIKIVPLYLERMRIVAVLDDARTELSSGPITQAAIRSSLESRFYVENVEIEREEMEISRQGRGYRVRINKELREPYLADLWFAVVVDEQIEISQ